MKSGIYKILNIINGKFYIGSAYYFSMRFGQHRWELRNNKHFNKYLQSSWNKYGESNFKFEIVEVCDKSILISREQYYIDTLKPHYNLSPNAGSTAGKKHSEEAKAKMRLKIISEETKIKISNSHKGKILTNEHKLKIGYGNKGKIISKETKEKTSNALRGKTKSEQAKENMSIAHRNFEKWRCPQGIRCKCEECKLKMKAYKKEYYQNKKLNNNISKGSQK